jgi:2-polyprenyl-3-methyl-5-hydroxy-6-metoxy-1,4-benzoquinol methylase
MNIPYQDKIDPWSSHSLLAGWLRTFSNGTRLLDIGTATGTLGRLCQGSGLELDGLEPNPEWADQARPFYARILVGVLEEAPDDFLAGHQIVICADVLEHLQFPEKAFKRLVDLQPDGTIFLISVPNIANLSVRLSLLIGRFEYQDRGILDRTHLHFFTRKTFLSFLERAGLKVEQIQATPIPLPLVHPFFFVSASGRWIHHCLAAVTRLFPTLLGYQFVARCVK